MRDGAVFRWVERTALADAYPPQLCTRLARIIRDESPIAAFGKHATAVAFRFAAELESFFHRGKRTKGHAKTAASATEQQLGGSGDQYFVTLVWLRARWQTTRQLSDTLRISPVADAGMSPLAAFANLWRSTSGSMPVVT